MRELTEAHFTILRRHMVEVIAIHVELAQDELGKAALDPRVLAAMADVPRHRFVPALLATLAYDDAPLPIGFDKSISQPFIVAVITDLLAPLAGDTVLEVGTGLDYQTAVLARLVARVWSVEVVEEMALEAEARLARLEYPNVEIRLGDGSRGWVEHAPFDKLLVAAAAGRRGGGAGAHGHGQGRSRPGRAPADHPGPLRSAGDDGVIRTSGRGRDQPCANAPAGRRASPP
jgi:protein-L-isoaspartate(D-aspartate) O-methyltransferase